MADYIVKDTELTSVANAIRTAGGTNSLLNFPNGFVSAVNNISGGGGGSSDFSIAEVTVSVGDSPNVTLECAIADNYESDYYSNYNINIQNDTVVNVILYKGYAFAQITSAIGTITTSGSITEYGEGVYGITGDCTITIS